MIKGFKDFILRGNVIDLAVAVVIGAAFGVVVTALVDNLVNPLIGAAFNADDLTNAIDLTIGGATLKFGAILAAIINFVAVAAVVYFVLVYPMNKFKEIQAARAGVVEEEAGPTSEELLVQIRDLLAKNNAGA